MAVFASDIWHGHRRRAAALALALVTVAAPAVVSAQEESEARGPRGGHRGGEPVGNIAGDWSSPGRQNSDHQRREPAVPQAMPEAYRAPAVPAPQVQTAPQWSGPSASPPVSASDRQPVGAPIWRGRTDNPGGVSAPRSGWQNRNDNDNDRWRAERDRERAERDRERERDRIERERREWERRAERERNRWRSGGYYDPRYPGYDSNYGYRYGGDYGYRQDRDYRRWDNRWRDDRRYDWYSYRRSNPSVFRLDIYYAPYRGYSYRRLNIGTFLETLFFRQEYWIGSPDRYRLPQVYGSYRWVRYYDDALLVNVYNGEVVDAVYNVFW